MRQQAGIMDKKRIRMLLLSLLAAAVVLITGMAFRADAAAVSLSRSSRTMQKGASFTLKLNNVRTRAASQVKWTSSNKKVASVTADGNTATVTANRRGTCTVSAVFRGKTYTCQITVIRRQVNNGTVSAVRHHNFRLKVSGKVTSWTTSNANVATVTAAGLVKPVAKGTVTICALTYNYRYRWTVTVKAPNKNTLTTCYDQASNKGKIVLAGSSIMERWTSAATWLKPCKVINMGIGGSKASQWLNSFCEPLIAAYEPSAVILAVGSNDIGNMKGTYLNGRQTGNLICRLLSKLSDELGSDTPIFYVSILPTWRRPNAWKAVTNSNRIVRRYCAAHSNMYYIDIASLFVNAKGEPNLSLFAADKLHPNNAGYKLIGAKVAKVVSRVLK